MAKKTFTHYDFEYLNGFPLRDLLEELTAVYAQDKNAVVSIRQTDGTDFPPFLTVESKAEYEQMNKEGLCPVCC